MNGRIYEVVVFDSLLTPAQREEMVFHLARRYGIRVSWRQWAHHVVYKVKNALFCRY